MSKSVMFQGITFNVPDWAKYIAKDSDGEVYAFAQRPIRSEDGIYTNMGGEVAHLGNVDCVEIL